MLDIHLTHSFFIFKNNNEIKNLNDYIERII